MNPKYERVKEIFKKSYRDTATVMIGWNDADKEIVDQIVAHNQKCDKDPSINNREFWEYMMDMSYGMDDILYAIIDSPYAPNDIIEEATRKSMNPQNMLRALERDIAYEPRTLDLIQKKAKREICEELKSCYNTYQRRPLPFNQHAIDYYAQKTFNKPNVKNDKMLIMLAYAKDEMFLKDINTNPVLNEMRLNYIISNENIPEEIRDKMFVGIGFNHDDITPDYNAILSPTKFMVEEIYRSNSDAYFYADKSEKNIKNAALNKLHEMYRHGLFGESIEKDIIARYQKGDSTYRWLLRCVLHETKNLGTIEFAKMLDNRIYSEVFQNPNIQKEKYQELAGDYIDAVLKSVKRAKRLTSGSYNVGKPLATTPLRRDQYESFEAAKDACINASMVQSPYVPMDIMEKLANFHDEKEEGYHYLNVALSARINCEMRKAGFTNEEVHTWSQKFVQHMTSYYNIDGVMTYNSVDKDYVDLIENGKLDDLINLIKKIEPDIKDERAQEAIKNFYYFANGYSDAYFRNLSDKIDETTIKKLYDQRNNIMNQFRNCNSLGSIYVKIDKYADELIAIANEIDKREEAMKEKSSRDYSR